MNVVQMREQVAVAEFLGRYIEECRKDRNYSALIGAEHIVLSAGAEGAVSLAQWQGLTGQAVKVKAEILYARRGM